MQKICDNCHRRFWTEENPDHVVLTRHNYNKWFCSIECAKEYCSNDPSRFKKALKKKTTVRYQGLTDYVSNAPVGLI